MANRREFLQGAAAASAVPIAAKAAWAERAGAPLSDLTVVVDTRFAASHAFGVRMSDMGAQTVRFFRDVTDVWRDTLRAAWTERRTPVAGLTAPPALFCLERLAWDHGMRVAFQAEHRPRSDGAIAHTAPVGGELLSAVELENSGEMWIDVLAQSLAGRADAAGAHVRPTEAGLRPTVADGIDDMLTSWVIAPRTRVAAA